MVTRWLVYKKEHVRAMYLAGGKVGAPPPYENWKFVGFLDERTKKKLDVDTAWARLQSRVK